MDILEGRSAVPNIDSQLLETLMVRYRDSESWGTLAVDGLANRLSRSSDEVIYHLLLGCDRGWFATPAT